MPLIQSHRIAMHSQATPLDLKVSSQPAPSSCTSDKSIPASGTPAPSTITTPTATAPPHPHLSINTSNTAASTTSEAIRTHSYWSGFYKKTIKERRTQLSLAFPHLALLSPLDSFASTQTSAKTSGQSTPNPGPVRPMTMAVTNIAPPTTLLSSSPLPRTLRSPLTFPMSRSSLSSLQNSITAETLDQEQIPLATSPEAAEIESKDSLLRYTDEDDQQQQRVSSGSTDRDKSSQQQQQQQPPPLMPQLQLQDMDPERRALDIELGQGQEAELMTEEERRDQFEKERRPTVISNLEEQRKMIGSADGKLLEGDLSLHARLDALIATEQEGMPFPVQGLDEQIANNMIENCIGTMGLPMGLGFNFSINGSPMVIPMAIEEPSVVAAVSSAAKTISSYQGFQAWAPERNMIIAQVQLLDILDSKMDQVVAKMEAQEMDIREEANEYCTNMVLRGGGVQRVTLHRVRRHTSRESFKGQDLLVKYGVVKAQSLPARTTTTLQPGSREQGRCSEWLVVHLHIDVGDAMGANCANTVAEGIAPYLAKLSGGRIGVRILSNLNVDRIAKSTFRLPFSHMGYKSVPGHEVAVRVLEAYEWADLDPYRAATHNKGIMNGIDAVALATGQDWRAVEAGAHAWASGAGTFSERTTQAATRASSSSSLSPPPPSNGHKDSNGTVGNKRKFGMDDRQSASDKIYRGDAYKPLTRYWIEEDEERLRQGYKGQDALVFCGELEIPIMVGTKGGVLSTNPVHAFALGVMRYPDSKQLAMAMATVGLAQNFAALRALVTEGIQRGHMSLHARNIAISAGTPPASVDEVTAYMIDTGKIRLGAAKSYIEQRGLGLGLAPFYSSSSSGLTSNSTTTNTTSTAATATATTTTTATTTAATLAAVTAPSVITATTTTTTSATSINGTDSSHGPNGTSTDMEMASTSAQVRHNCDEGS